MNIQGFLQTLPIMLYGMIGIFAVSVAIYLCILLLRKIFPMQK